MENKSGSNVFKFILMFCGGFLLGILALIGYQSYIGYDDSSECLKCEEQLKEGVSEDDKESSGEEINNSDEIISYSDVAGHYSGLSDVDADGLQYSTTLILWEDGTFKYEISDKISGGFWGYIGNYKLEEEKIILNGFFETGGGTGFNLIGKEISLTIDDDMSLTEIFYGANNKQYSINYRKLSQQEIDNGYEADITFNDIIKNNCSEEDNCIYISE